MATTARASSLRTDRNGRIVPRRQLVAVLSVLAAFFAVLLPLQSAAAAAPSAPDGLSAEPTSPTQVHLAWNTVSDATSYSVSRSTVDGGPYLEVGTPTTTSLDDNVNADTAYYYVVQATTVDETSPNSGQAAALTGAVTGLQVALRTNTDALLQWNPSPLSATVWELQRSVSASGPFAGIASPSTPTFQDTQLDPATTYFYRVRATTPWTSLFSSTVSATSALDHLVLTPATVTITSGDSQAYTAEGFDALDNSLGDVTAATTFTVTPDGSCSDAVCTATLAGDHTVTGTKDAKTGTAALSVTAGAFDHLVVSPATANIASGGSQDYTAEAFDAANNSLRRCHSGDDVHHRSRRLVHRCRLHSDAHRSSHRDRHQGRQVRHRRAQRHRRCPRPPRGRTRHRHHRLGGHAGLYRRGLRRRRQLPWRRHPRHDVHHRPRWLLHRCRLYRDARRAPHRDRHVLRQERHRGPDGHSPGPGAGGRYQPLAPVRILNTRNGVGAPIAPIGAGQAFDLPVTKPAACLPPA